MRIAHAVIGANYGDEGKGLVVDYLCRLAGAETVVRFNGGAQAGHTVVTPDGRRHVFKHLSSGTFAGAATHLSEYFVTNPLLFRQEVADLISHGCSPPRVTVHPQCLVTTPFDMLINQLVEAQRAGKRHGSCGIGFNETIERHRAHPLTVVDLVTDERYVESICAVVSAQWAPKRLQALGVPADAMFLYDYQRMADDFMQACRFFLANVTVTEIFAKDGLIFEGAQGLGLCMSNTEDFPHLTRSFTGLHNVLRMSECRVDKLFPVYVTRSYLTRHGAGPLPGEEPMPGYVVDNTNIDGPWQGPLRFAPLDPNALRARINRDLSEAGGSSVHVKPHSVAVTHIDQLQLTNAALTRIGPVKLLAHGPTANDLEVRKDAHAAANVP